MQILVVLLVDQLCEAYMKAFSCDTTSAFGGIIALNQTIDKDTAEQIIKIFTEVIIAPGINDEAKEIFKSKNNLRVLILTSLITKITHITTKVLKGNFSSIKR